MPDPAEKTTSVSLSLNRGLSWSPEDREHPGTRRRWTLRVEDENSSMTVTELRFSDIELAELLAGVGAVAAEATWAPTSALTNLGRHRWTASLRVAKYRDQAVRKVAEESLGEIQLDNDVRMRLNDRRDGVYLSLTGFADDEKAAALTAEQALLAADRWCSDQGLLGDDPHHYPRTNDTQER